MAALGVIWADGLWDVAIWDAPIWLQAEDTVEVPDVVGQSQASATAELEGLLFVVVVATAYDNAVPAGDVISQVPIAGAQRPEGSTVTITVSLGPQPAPSASDVTGGGFIHAFEIERERRRRARKKREEEEAEAERIQDERDREIAALLHKQEAEDARRKELDRLKALVRRHTDTKLDSDRLQKAFERALTQENVSAYLALEREMERMFEEEEMIVLTLLLQ